MIPHIIHYCWFGPAQKSALIRRCIASWQKYLPGWEIIEWNESNYDVSKIRYIRDAYEQKKWAFVVDYARFDILNQYGGVFLDTDVELLHPFTEEMLDNAAFTGFESMNQINPGLVYASEAGQKILHSIMSEYEHREFTTKETICDVVTGILVKEGLKNDDSFQRVGGVTVYPSEYFCCFDHETQHYTITDRTVSIHHYAASWSPWYRKIRFRSIRLIAEIMGPERYKRIKHRILKRSR